MVRAEENLGRESSVLRAKLARIALYFGLAGGALGAAAGAAVDFKYDLRNLEDAETIQTCVTDTDATKDGRITKALQGCLETGNHHAAHRVIIDDLEVGDPMSELTDEYEGLVGDATQPGSIELAIGAFAGAALPIISLKALGRLPTYALEGVILRRQALLDAIGISVDEELPETQEVAV